MAAGRCGCAGLHRRCHPHPQLTWPARRARTGRISDATIEAGTVVTEALAALGRQPTVIPGRLNRVSSFVMRRLLSRRLTITIMGNVLRGMYVQNESQSHRRLKS